MRMGRVVRHQEQMSFELSTMWKSRGERWTCQAMGALWVKMKAQEWQGFQFEWRTGRGGEAVLVRE